MLTQEEKDFILYWETNRDRRKKLFRQLLVGIPMGLLFGVPIVLNYVLGWYKRANMVSGSQSSPLVLLVAILLIISFVAIFYKQHQWEQYEQKYRELKQKEGE
ncbi:hypothetical protein ACFSQD_06390 [Flavihumibacter stibioxidans]|uniref:Uncharacterized protein n=1 Tax=Flavihumibacter stibioxidans TaxID=1834163 RepID=A0ABR7M5K1_9BACT|nr:hypothetical protein [Flavihumibacter stibioxidans]MBC6489936.1 hypothetical protein [Flavihumibacter stibioxidans]